MKKKIYSANYRIIWHNPPNKLPKTLKNALSDIKPGIR